VVALLFVLERGWGFRFESSSRVTYERIDLIQPGRYAELLADLRARTGLPVTRAKVGRIDFLRDSAELTLYYTQAESEEAGRGLRPLQNPHLGSDGGMV
jgi:hypothetical protein